MSWNDLKTALHGMENSGEKGFEGLCATLLSQLLNIPFRIARSGTQSSGDALSQDITTSLQAKKYADDTRFRENEIEGDIRRILREIPDLQVYVLAATRSTAQIEPRLKDIEKETGLDIIVLETGDGLSDMGALCITYWTSIQEFAEIGAFQNTYGSWVQQTATLPEVQERVRSLQVLIGSHLQTFNRIRNHSKEYLTQRFEITKGTPTRNPYRIVLDQGIKRVRTLANLWKWWEGKEPVAYLEGEEGVGKSWLAADFINDLSEKENTLIIWLDSEQWCTCKNIEDLLNAGLGLLAGPDENTRLRLVSKAQKRWPPKQVFALDGVNEREAIIAAKVILKDFFFNQEYSRQFRFLLTTRPLQGRLNFERNIWNDCTPISVRAFDDNELDQALKTFAPDITKEMLSDSLKPIARIPRYFKTCIRLKDRFRGIDNVTKELVLWEDLKEKIQYTDAQVYQRLGWMNQKDAEAVIAYLAQTCVASRKGGINIDELNRCFSHGYNEVRQDLIDLRIARTGTPLSLSLNPNHVVLGWGLYLRSRLLNFQKQEMEDLVELIRQELEPIPEEDNKTEAIFVALQLTAVEESTIAKISSSVRAALLLSWCRSHNAKLYSSRLEFWCQEDLPAYAQFIENVFIEFPTISTQDLIVSPLGRLWQMGSKDQGELEKVLQKWLLLTWNNELEVEKDFVEYGSYRLPVAKNRDQLRLSAIAISIISLRPDPAMLQYICLCRATCNLSYEKNDKHTWTLKRLEENLGVLIRWGYTEDILPELEKVTEGTQDNVLLCGARLLARSLHVVNLPLALQETESKPERNRYRLIRRIDKIRQGQSVFKKEEGEFISGNLALLAVRKDLPDLVPEDAMEIQKIICRLVQTGHVFAARGATKETFEYEEMWPWYARLFPDDVGKILYRLLINTTLMETPRHLIYHLAGSFPFRKEESGKDLMDVIKELATRYITCEKGSHDYQLELLSEYILFLAKEDEVYEWLNHMEGKQDAIIYHPLPELFPLLMGSYIAIRVREKTLDFYTQLSKRRSDTEIQNTFGYWLYLWSLVAVENDVDFKWAVNTVQEWNGETSVLFWLFRLTLRTNTSSFWNTLLEERILAKQLDIIHFPLLDLPPVDKAVSCYSYEDLMNTLPRDIVGEFLYEQNRKDDLDRWVHEIMDLAYQLVQTQLSQAESRLGTYFQFDKKGKAVFRRPTSEEPRVIVEGFECSSWGMDYDRGKDLKDVLGENDDEKHSQEFERWKSDWERLHHWEGYSFNRFCAYGVFKEWARQNPSLFIDPGKNFLIKAKDNFQACFHMGLFINAVLTSLLPFEPIFAFDIYRQLHSGSYNFDVVTHYGVSEFIGDLWNLSLCTKPEHWEIRHRLLSEAENEEEIMQIVMASLAEGSQDELRGFAINQCLKHRHAKERCLGVAILPWLADKSSIDLLDVLKNTDPSYWVREYAAWALDLAWQEKSCRDTYEEILVETDPYRVSAKLQCIKPALLPTAMWWRDEIEEKVNLSQQCQKPIIKAILISFWHHWKSTSNNRSNIEVQGRKLKEYCRGENLDRFKSARLAPWWKI
jgi:hypothetical protein